MTEATARFMRHRLGGQRQEHILDFGERRTFTGPAGAFHLTLLPAGHICGSAMALVENGEGRLLYTGDFKLRPGLSAERCDIAPAKDCETLVMETTFGRQKYRFPPAVEVRADLVRFCHETLTAGATPMLLCYALGKSQELLLALADAGLPIMLERTVLKITRIQEALGWKFPAYERLDPDRAAGHVVVCAPHQARESWMHRLNPVRKAVATGWAMDSGCRFRYGVDAAFPLSDHADFDELIECVEFLRPKRVLTLHGFAADFAATLRELGHDARALSEVEQLPLPLGMRPAGR